MIVPTRTALTALLLAALCACEPADVELVATLYPTPEMLPTFELINADGNSVDRAFFEGQWDFVFFGFRNCPDICPTTLQRLRFARDTLAQRRTSPLPRVVLVSVDPERDTADALRDYIAPFGDGVTALTGEPAAIRDFADALRIYYAKSSDGENYNVDHSTVVLIVDPKAQVRGLYSYPQDPAVIADEFPILTRT